MKLINGEEKLLEVNGDELVLTTHRIRNETKSFGKRTITSLLLDELSSCQLSHRSHPLLLVFAFVGFIATIFAFFVHLNIAELAIILTVSLVLAAIFFITRKQVIKFDTAGASIIVKTKGMKPEIIKEFIDEAEIAKDAKKVATC